MEVFLETIVAGNSEVNNIRLAICMDSLEELNNPDRQRQSSLYPLFSNLLHLFVELVPTLALGLARWLR